MEIEVEPNINFNTNDEVVKEKSNILQQVEIQQLYKEVYFEDSSRNWVKFNYHS